MHPHNNPGVEKRFIISLALTSLVLLAEVIGGLWTGSLALLSDAAHVFMDIFALALSFVALRLSALPADDRHTYGYHRLEVLAALINGITLGAISIGIWLEAYERFRNPAPVRSTEMLVIAAIGLVVNLIVAFVLGGAHDHSHEPGSAHDHEHEKVFHPENGDRPAPARDLNLQSAYLHVIGDAVSSVGVIIAALLIGWTGWQWIDPLVSVLIGVLIVFSAWRVLRASIHILIEGVPDGMDIQRIAQTIQNVPAVREVHDLHVWNICSGRVALSAHIALQPDNGRQPGQVITDLNTTLRSQFGIEHSTFQLESPDLDCTQR